VDEPGAVTAVIEGRERDIGGLAVHRVLPSMRQRTVGPFVFLDHFGPVTVPPGGGIDVRPHPHINLATVTYLFEGEIVHRDSLGSHQVIRPGDINWMTAGRGIVHSERTDPARRAAGGRSHGIQLWLGLPAADEETAPAFHHHPADTLPGRPAAGASLRVMAGSAYGLTAPVQTFSPLFYVDAALDAGATLPLPEEHEQRAAYVATGRVRASGQEIEAGRLVVFSPGGAPTLRADTPARLVLLGGAPLDGERHLWWNFVSSRRERIEAAARDWSEGRFPRVPGDEVEFIPLPAR
jgi:redox-sensitive bicupin YhaK (pirin superfamily)